MTLRQGGPAEFDSSQDDNNVARTDLRRGAGLRARSENLLSDNPYLSPSASHRSFQDHVVMVRERIWLVLLLTVAGVAIAGYKFVGSPPMYMAQAIVSIVDDREKYFYAPSSVGDPTVRYFRNYVFFRVNTLREVVNSLAVRQAVAERLAKSSVQLDQGTGSSGKRASRSVVPPPVSVSSPKRTSVIMLNTRCLDREMALQSLSAYLEVFQGYYKERKHADAVKALAWLKDRLIKSREDLDQARKALAEYRKEHVAVPDAEGAALVRDFAVGWMDELQIQGKDGSRNRFRGYGTRGESGPSQVRAGVHAHLDGLSRRLTTLQSQYATMGEIYEPTYPRMVLLSKKISFVQNMISDLEQKDRTTLDEERDKEEDRRRAAREDGWYESVRNKAAGPQMRLLQMDVDTVEVIYDTILDEYKKAEQRVSSVSDDFVLTHPPSVNEIKPPIAKRLASGGLAGMVAGIALALTLGGMDNRIRSGADIEARVAARSLGSVPDLSLNRKDSAGQGMNTSGMFEFVAYEDADSPIFEPIRNVQSSIFLSSAGRNIRSIAVSSCLPGEGKTLIAVSLASVMSLDKRKSVLLIDADLRRPRVHKVFGHTHPRTGLTTLVRKGSVDWSGMVHSSHFPGLYYMMAGPIPHDPVAVLRSETLEEVIVSLKASFDLIVIDTPPVLGFPDAVIASTLVDGTVVVAEQGLVREEVMREALKSLGSARGVNVLGVVLNKAKPPRKTLFGYYSGYRYGYGKYA